MPYSTADALTLTRLMP